MNWLWESKQILIPLGIVFHAVVIFGLKSLFTDCMALKGQENLQIFAVASNQFLKARAKMCYFLEYLKTRKKSS